MFARLAFPAIALFWVIMNVLLWRAEYGGGREVGSPVPSEVVWEKMLNAADESTLEISWNGKKIGYCRWVPNVNEGVESRQPRGHRPDLEGMVSAVSGYSIDLEGNVVVGDPPTRMRFTAHLRFSARHTWEDLSIRVAHRPMFWEVRANAAEETASFTFEDDGGKWSRTYTFEELHNPTRLLQDLGGAWTSTLTGLTAGLPAGNPLRDSGVGLRWEGHSDLMKIGHARVRVYRLQARLLDRYEVGVTVSRGGEIMRVELPGGIQLANEALTNL
jgi:hypothetical protein